MLGHGSQDTLVRLASARPPLAGAVVALALTAAGCASTTASNSADSSTVITAIGAENEYANVLAQIGGRYVRVSSILDNPNTDPHTFEASPAVAQKVSSASLIVQNGVGYDSWISKMEAASPNPQRKVIVAQSVLGLPDSTPNPHLWYDPKTMPAVAKAMAADLSDLVPAHKAYFRAEPGGLRPLARSLAAAPSRRSRRSTRHTVVATTEPVADYLLQAMGITNLTPFTLPGRHHERR